MKRLKLLLLTVLCSINMLAQNSPLIGTWEGTLSMEIPDPNSDGTKNYQYKAIVRIKQYDGDYLVRMKNVPTEEPSKARYFDNCTIISSSPTTLTWNCGNEKSYDCGYIVNGHTVHSAEFSYNCSVKFDKGRLCYSYYMHTIYRNKREIIIGTHDTPILGETYLYSQEGDW